MVDKMAPGGGGRFAQLEGKLDQKKGVTDPKGLAAYIGRRKFGAARMASMAAAGAARAK